MCNRGVFSLNFALEAYIVPAKWLTISLILSILTVKNRLINCEGRKSYECACTQIHTVYTHILKILSSSCRYGAAVYTLTVKDYCS